jgi:signal transduction histidine kinase
MNHAGYAFIGLTAVVAALVAVLVFAFLRFSAAARGAKGRRDDEQLHSALMSSALHDAVTKLKAQEQAMSVRAAESEQLSVQIVDSLTAGFLLVDRAGTVEIMNQPGRRMLNIASDAPGADYRQLLAGVAPLVDVIAEALSTAHPIVRRKLRLSDKGRPTHIGVTVSPLAAADSARGVICLFSDLSDVVELEEQLRLKDTLAQLGELTAGIAHEFRNGLATIHGYSRLIDPQEIPEKYRPYIQGLRQETEALGRVVTNFLQFAKPEQIVLTDVNLEQLVRRSSDELRHDLPAGTTFTVTGEFATIQGDEVLLRQAISNLVRNAADACVGANVAPVIAIAGEVDARQRTCSVTVHDNGPGIPAGTRHKVFQPFFTTRSNGTGLGLAIVQKVAVMHNGRIAVGDSSHGGASLQLTFPIGRDTAPSRSAAA